jgi:hypothetical protein
MHRIIVSITVLLLASANAHAQDRSTTYQTPQGEVTVNSGQPQPRDYGPAPSFAQLDRAGSGALGSAEAEAYPPLANDFIHADRNRDGRISRAEYERWAAHQ